jgi:sarcosine oxidase/L-pipecolate oxidase
VTTHAGISAPRTYSSHGEDGLRIPKAVLTRFRSFLKNLYPELAEKPFIGTRLCWYNDTPDADYLIGRYPNDDGLILATGDSGHAYKMLPVLGTLVADLIMGNLDPVLVDKFAIDRGPSRQDGSRRVADAEHAVPSEELNLAELCTPQDLTL